MPIDLTRIEPGAAEDVGASDALANLRARLSRLQLRQLAHRKRTILLVEGWEATGKRSFLRQVLASLDPCSVNSVCLEPTPIGTEDRHWLAKYWGALPGAGHSALFFRSWYRALVDERVHRQMSDKNWSRGCDEINEFEAQQRDHGTAIVKFFFHCSAEQASRRLDQRLGDPWERQLVHDVEEGVLKKRDAYLDVWNAAFRETDTRWAPWQLIDAENVEKGVVSAIQALVDTLEKLLPSELPATAPGEHAVIDFPGKALR